jgi:hypothetical protein
VCRFNDSLVKRKVLIIAKSVVGNLILHANQRAPNLLQVFWGPTLGGNSRCCHLYGDYELHHESQAIALIDGHILHAEGLALVTFKYVGPTSASCLDEPI